MSWTEVDKPAFADAIQALPGTMGQIVDSLYLPIIEYDDELRCVVRNADHDPKDPPPPGYGA